MKAYYHRAADIFCGVCLSLMVPHTEENTPSEGEIERGPRPVVFSCSNAKCPQHTEPVRIPPIEVDLA